MVVRPTEIRDILRQEIETFGARLTVTNVGYVVQVGDGIATVYGLRDVMLSELVEFSNGVMGMAYNLQEDSVGIIVLGDYTGIEEGDEVKATGRIAQVPVGSALLGRVVNALGEPIDGKGPIQTDKFRPIERIAALMVPTTIDSRPSTTGISLSGGLPASPAQGPGPLPARSSPGRAS
ncbi:hypothetical protein [Nitrolancea hollandica]|uniref:hypothetical protein n=1 Tax=Nitrolancea hollandica TaxID=1206749 RepID=UPI000309083E